MTLEQAKQLTFGTVLYHIKLKNRDGTPLKFRVNGKIKTWKRDPFRILIPIKHGLRDYAYVGTDGKANYQLHEFVLDEEDVGIKQVSAEIEEEFMSYVCPDCEDVLPTNTEPIVYFNSDIFCCENCGKRYQVKLDWDKVKFV